MEIMIISFNPPLASCHPSRSAHLDLDIPVIIVLGSQSAGKSSLIEAISGITLPRASGTCTRYASSNSRLYASHAPYRIPAGVLQNASFRTPSSHGVALSRSVWSQMRMESIYLNLIESNLATPYSISLLKVEVDRLHSHL